MSLTWRNSVGRVMAAAALAIALLSAACTTPERAPVSASAIESAGVGAPPTVTAVPSHTATANPVATASPTPEPKPTATDTPTPSLVPTRTAAPGPTALPTQTPEPARVPTLASMATQGPTPTPSLPSPLVKLEHGAWLEVNEPDLSMDLRRLPWVADGVDEKERESAELLIASARSYPEVFATLLTKPWVVDDITIAETDAIYGFTRTPLYSSGLAAGMLEISWAQDAITPEEGKAIGYLYRAIRWAPDISEELLAYSWLEPAVTPDEVVALEYLYKAGRYVHNLAEKLVGKPWVQDGITSHEASVIRNLYLIARAQDDSLESETNAIAAGLADMPFLDSIEGADRQAMESLRKLERDNTARFLEVMDHPVINDGITDQETKLVALLWGTNTYKPEYVDDVLTQTGIFVEERTIRMPISGEVLLAVFRHRDRVRPSMDYLEHSVTFMEDVMGNPLPSNYLAVFFTDAIPEDVGGKHFGTHIGAQPHFDLVGTARWKQTPFVIAHEVAHRTGRATSGTGSTRGWQRSSPSLLKTAGPDSRSKPGNGRALRRRPSANSKPYILKKRARKGTVTTIPWVRRCSLTCTKASARKLSRMVCVGSTRRNWATIPRTIARERNCTSATWLRRLRMAPRKTSLRWWMRS